MGIVMVTNSNLECAIGSIFSSKETEENKIRDGMKERTSKEGRTV